MNIRRLFRLWRPVAVVTEVAFGPPRPKRYGIRLPDFIIEPDRSVAFFALDSRGQWYCTYGSALSALRWYPCPPLVGVATESYVPPAGRDYRS